MLKLPAVLILLCLPGLALAVPDLEWARTYDGGGAYDDFPTCAITDGAGNLIIGGQSHDGIDGTDMLVRKYDRASGDAMWTRRVSAPDATDITVTDIVEDPAGDVLVAGHVLGCPG